MTNSIKAALTLETLSGQLSPQSYKGLFGALGDAPVLSFYLPEPGQMASLVLSLLKFGFPPHKLQQMLARFVTQLLATPRTSKRHLQKLPWPALEWLAQQLCLHALTLDVTPPLSLSADDLTVQLWLLFEELSEFDANALVKGDIQALGQGEFSRLHSYYYQNAPDFDILLQILKTHGFEKTNTGAGGNWLETFALKPYTQAELMRAYWCTRRLAYPLPWASIFSFLKTDDLLWRRLCEGNPFILHLVRRLALSSANKLACSRFEKPALDFEQGLNEVLQHLTHLQNQWYQPLQDSRAAQVTTAQIKKSRETLWGKRPYQRIILVEGNTEAILLPLMARLCHLKRFQDSPDAISWQVLQKIRHTLVMPVGGKNQMASLYKSLSEELRIPIAVLLDADARLASDQVLAILRQTPADVVLMIDPAAASKANKAQGSNGSEIENLIEPVKQGEIEDLYPIELLIAIINERYNPYPALDATRYAEIIRLEDAGLSNRAGIQPPVGRVAELKLLWQVLGLGRFDKVTLAQEVASHLAKSLVLPADSQRDWESLLPGALESLMNRLYGLSEEAIETEASSSTAKARTFLDERG
ncbi:MAG: ATP-dependent endonuclease [Vampirovibrionales bacterium]|nr:ATP-dependent endonuclease [Vampirovibrionales bacterium]